MKQRPSCAPRCALQNDMCYITNGPLDAEKFKKTCWKSSIENLGEIFVITAPYIAKENLGNILVKNNNNIG